MKIICDNCHTKYSISDSKLTPGKVFKIKCKKCGNVIVVKPGAEEPAPIDDEATRVVDVAGLGVGGGGPEAAKIWHVVIDKEQEGPYTIEEIKVKVDAGVVKPDTLGWREGMEDWTDISQIEEFKGFFPEAAAAAGPFGGAEEAKEDPFSAFDKGAQKEEPAPASASEKRDALFGDDDEDEEPAVKMKGQRHENSVLFSLDNLQALASGGGARKGMGGPKPGYITPSSTGSGLADIQDMAASLNANQAGAASQPMMDLPAAPVVATPLATAPVLAPAAPVPQAAPAAAGGGQAQGRPAWLIPVIIGVVVVIIAVAALFLFMGKGSREGEATKKREVVAQNGEEKPEKGADMKKTKGADMKGDLPGKVVSNDPKEPMNAPAAMAPEMGAPAQDPMKVVAETMGKTPRRSMGTRPSMSGSRPSPRTMSSSSTRSMRSSMRGSSSQSPSPPMNSGGCTKVWCMLKGNGPSCCCKYKPGGCGSMSSSGAADPCAGNSKASLSRGDIKSGISRVRGRVRSCFSKYGVHGKVKVRVTVGCNGRVKYAGARGSHSGTPVGKCIQRAVRGARFPKFKKKQLSFTYPFIG